MGRYHPRYDPDPRHRSFTGRGPSPWNHPDLVDRGDRGYPLMSLDAVVRRVDRGLTLGPDGCIASLPSEHLDGYASVREHGYPSDRLRRSPGGFYGFGTRPIRRSTVGKRKIDPASFRGESYGIQRESES